MFAKVIIVILFIAIFISLFSALFFLIKGTGHTDINKNKRTVRALSIRIGLSIGLLVILLIANKAGVIKPHGINPVTVSVPDKQ
ncbi:MAG: twin transmembrane helix small protein [Gammaproteobacteria bacterium]|nr:twin transmembrane helix small protein [Gammaproteobacteria bacterium]